MEAPEKIEAKSVKISEPVKKSWEKEGMREEKKEEKKDDKKDEEKEEKKDEKKDEEKKDEKDFEEDGFGGDSFMREMTKKFGVEGGKDKEVPNGEFWFDRKGAREVAIQTLLDYKHLNKGDSEAWVCDNFEEAWEYMDPGTTGKIEADRMPRFLTYLAHQ
jgi:ABC-type Zn2+ transport system substrate-binding protein/surface adhesin